MKTLKLFNAVEYKEPIHDNPFIDYENGLIIESGARWCVPDIVSYYTQQRLSGNDLNKTFHKSWEKVLNSSRLELLIHQINHYISTYGSDFQDEIYIPEEILDVPDVKLKFKVVKALTKEQLIDKCLNILKSGMALNEETLDDIINLLDELNYQFTGKEGIRNKEAIVKIAEQCDVYPEDPVEFFRYVIYRTTGETLLIKNDYMIDAIKWSNYNPSPLFKKYDLKRLAEIFNRFKPLFLAFKSKCPKTINKISRLSKVYHKPLVQNPLNMVTNRYLEKGDEHWLNNATPFALFKALNACYTRMSGQTSFVYRIRNGKSWASENGSAFDAFEYNFETLLYYMKKRFDFKGTKVYIPEDVDYALPTSEKMFVGNIPTGSKFYGESLAVGIYWKNSWGARDLDLSGIGIGGKIGWNSDYYNSRGSLIFSGDITNAPNGAVEYLYANYDLNEPTLVMNNVYVGSEECDYKIIVGRGDDINRDYMMNPNNLFMETKCQSVKKQTVLGLFLPEDDEKQSFVLLNFGAGHARVSGNSKVTDIATKALYEQWNHTFMLNTIIEELGGKIVKNQNECNVDLSLDSLEKDTFIQLFKQREFL